MDRVVCYIPSYNDSQQAIESLATCADWDVVISDNHSSAQHAEALSAAAAAAGPRVQVVRQPQPLGRVGNWKACVEHFIASGAAWMKFLSTGDRHRPDCLAIYRRAIERYPEARFIIGQIKLVRPVNPSVWACAPEDVTIEPAMAMEMAAHLGNVFFGLIAPVIHAETVRDGFTFGEDVLSYCTICCF